MTKRSRSLVFGGLLAFLAGAGLFAQPKVRVPGQSAAPAKLSVVEATTPTAVAVSPGPEPWYTVFGTSEVIGFIEPCG